MTPPVLRSDVKFATYSYRGIPTAYYVARPTVLPEPDLSSTVGHHVIVVDRSGSMWGDPIKQVRSVVEKVLTLAEHALAEYADSRALASVISYSSSGDMTIHVARTPLSEVMRPGSPAVASIRSLRATYLTCVSQALEAAKALIRDDETTGISVHTDGYFNDRSAAEESRRVDAFIADMRGRRNVFVNTIAYGYADTGILLRIANALSGKCIQARSSSAVYDALRDTTALLAGRTAPPVTVPIAGTDGGPIPDYQALVSVSARKVNGTTTDLAVRGLGAGDDAVVWRYRKVKREAFEASPAVLADAGAPGSLTPVYAFIRSALAEGRLAAAKYALLATRNADLVDRHLRALTTEQRADFAADVEAALYDMKEPSAWRTQYGLDTTTKSILELVPLLEKYRDDWTLDLPAFLDGYTKRGLKRIPGAWIDGKLVPPAARLVAVDDPTRVSLSGFTLNNAAASLQMRIQRDAALVVDEAPAEWVESDQVPDAMRWVSRSPRKHLQRLVRGEWHLVMLDKPGGTCTLYMGNWPDMPGITVDEAKRRSAEREGEREGERTLRHVAGKKLDLHEYRNYTLVGDGAVNATSLPVYIASRDLHEHLVAGHLLPDRPYNAKTRYDIPLATMPVIPWGGDGETLDGGELAPPTFVFDELLGLSVMASILRACLPGGTKAEKWTEEQRAELGAVYLSPGLNFSPPTTTPYMDLADAIRAGLVDTRVRTHVTVMNAEIAGLEHLYSGNAYLQRRFTVSIPPQVDADGIPVVRPLTKAGHLEKPTWVDVRTPGAVVQRKVLTPRVEAGLDAIDVLTMPYVEAFLGMAQNPQAVAWEGVTSASSDAEIGGLLGKVTAGIERLRTRLRPLVFSVGASGLLPDSWGDVPAMTAEALLEKYPKLFLSKAQEDGTYFQVGAFVLGVYAETVYYSTPAGVAAARALSDVDADEE